MYIKRISHEEKFFFLLKYYLKQKSFKFINDRMAIALGDLYLNK